ncbi:MAG: fumarylacetoacetate hydrolase family protein [Acidobacteria bacterium]|nr:fumarylacetoacetate hydrolase family protein [Acidobacteriota bacterium]
MRKFITALLLGCTLLLPSIGAKQATISSKPETPFKLATFEAQGRVRVGLVLGTRILDIAGADSSVPQEAGALPARVPADMRELIEIYDRVSPRLYRMANFFKDAKSDSLPFAFDVEKVSIKAPIKYPYNLLAAAANYRSHAGEMLGRGAQAQAVNEVDPDKSDPVMFAKSPRSCIIDPGEPFFMPAGRNIDWEGELAIVIGRQAFNVPEQKAHEYVFGYSIMYDASDRGGTGRPLTSMFQGPNWFSGKSRDRAAPFGPFIVPKEFLTNHANLRIVTKVNGIVKQDGNTKDLIWDEAHLVRYLTSILTLYPGDVISTGTPDGVGAARRPPEFLKPGDVVTIEIEGIGALTTPMRAAATAATQ